MKKKLSIYLFSERSQPLKRQRFGLLEKHADYVKRARDFHSKEDRLNKMKEKAEGRNKDEFYFGMIKSRTSVGLFSRFLLSSYSSEKGANMICCWNIERSTYSK